LKLLVINISPSFPAINKHRRHLLPAMCHDVFYRTVVRQRRRRIDNTWPRSNVNSTHWRQILAQNRDFCLPHLHSTSSLGRFPSEYCYAIWYGKTRMGGYSAVKKNEDTFIRFDIMYERDRHTDRRTDTPWRHRPRLHSIARRAAKIAK